LGKQRRKCLDLPVYLSKEKKEERRTTDKVARNCLEKREANEQREKKDSAVLTRIPRRRRGEGAYCSDVSSPAQG